MKYEEFHSYIYGRAAQIANSAISRNTKDWESKRLDLAEQIREFIIEVRMTDREISLEAQDEWRKLPVIEAEA